MQISSIPDGLFNLPMYQCVLRHIAIAKLFNHNPAR